MEYKRLQAELDDINNGLADVDKELNYLQEGTSQFMVCTFLSVNSSPKDGKCRIYFRYCFQTVTLQFSWL